MPKKCGFTLIELLIAISVVMALAGIGMYTLPGVQKKARDAQRRNDLRHYENALREYASTTGGFYPRRSGSSIRADTTLCSDVGLSNCPSDPRDGKNVCDGGMCRYYYQTESACGTGGADCARQYVLWARVEQPEDTGENYYVICSDGRKGMDVAADLPPSTAGSCPL